MLYAEFGALAHRGLGCLRSGTDYDSTHPAWDCLQVGVTLVAFDAIGVGIDREDLITSLA